MSNFQMPIKEPKEIVPRLGRRDLHWRDGRSAFELSTAWMQAGGIPSAVEAVLNQAPEWRPVELLEGIFERETRLPGRGRPSQTDLLAIVRLDSGNAILGVEGKVDESFGPPVERWLAGSRADDDEPDDGNRQARLEGLCATLLVDPATVGGLYYQLFHRTCAAIYEARRFGYRRAAMLVHSFAATPLHPATPTGFEEFAAFALAVGMPVERPDAISPARVFEGVEMRLAWASDTVTG